MSALKPCPFCGASGNIEIIGAPEIIVYVHCGSCVADGPGSDESLEEAVAAWNKAPRRAALREIIDIAAQAGDHNDMKRLEMLVDIIRIAQKEIG